MKYVLLAILAAAGGASAITWSPPVELATGGGERGPWQQNNSRYDFVDDPSVALMANGDAGVVWVDQKRKDVFWQIVAPDGSRRLANPIDVSRTPAEFSWLPRIALSPRDPSHVYILWQEIIFSGGPHGGEMFFARSTDGGRTFEPPQNLTKSVAGEGKGRFNSEIWHNGSFDIAVGPDDTIYTAWTDYEGELTIRRSRDGGKTFDPEVVVAKGGTSPTRAPSLAVGANAVYVAWTIGETDDAAIHVASSHDGTTFSAPATVEARVKGYSDSPKLALDASGTLHLAFARTAGGPFGAAEVRYTRSRDGHAFDPTRVISSPLTSGTGGAFPSLAVDGPHVVISWENYPERGGDAHGLGISYSMNDGDTFSSPAVIPGTIDAGRNGGFEGRLTRKLALRGENLVAVNSAKRPGESSRVWMVRGTLPAPRTTAQK